MSIMCCVYIPEGIVLAADSRLTRTKTGNITEIPETDTTPKTILIPQTTYTSSDNTQKVMLIKKSNVGISFCGNAIIDGATVADFIRRFEIEKVMPEHTTEQIAYSLSDFSSCFTHKICTPKVSNFWGAYHLGKLDPMPSKAALLILNKLSRLTVSRHQLELLFKIISGRGETSNTIVITNLPFSKWTDLFENTTMVAAPVDRLIFRSHVLDMEHSYMQCTVLVGKVPH